MKNIILLIVFILSFVNPLCAQKETNENHKNYFFLHLGIGISQASKGPITEHGGGLMARLGMAFEFYHFVVSSRFSVNTGGKSTHSSMFWNKYMHDEYYEVALLAGYNLSKQQRIRVIPSVGISRVGGKHVISKPGSGSGWFGGTGSLESFKPRIGIPLELAIVGSGKHVGAGLYLHLNLSQAESFYGISINFVFGKL